MQYNQFNHVAKRQKFILRPAPSSISERKQAQKQRNNNPMETTHNDQKRNRYKKQWRANVQKNIFDACPHNHSNDLQEILKHKLTITEYPQLVTNKSGNFINKIGKHKKLLKGRKDQARQSRYQSEMKVQKIKDKGSDKTDKVEYDKFLNDKLSIAHRSGNYTTGMKKIEQQGDKLRTSYSNMFKSQATNLIRKKKIKILLKTFQNNGKQSKLYDKILSMKSMKCLPKKSPILQQNKQYRIFQSARELYDSIHRGPQQFLQQYLKHKKQRETPEIKQKQTTTSQSQQRILQEIRQYVDKNYNKDEFCNYYSARLSSQNEFRLKVRKNSKKKKQDDAEQDRECIEAWKQINEDNQLENNFMKSTGLRAQLQNEQDQIIEFMNRQKY